MVIEMNEAEKDFKSKGTVSKRFTIPVLLWEEWQKDCEINFQDAYYLKMQYDHEFRKSMEPITQVLLQDIADLRERIEMLEADLEEPEEPQKTKTFGD